ncbi:MAG: RsiV family protein [Lachnospiraceae bacterium]|nr:RsiV family protein [Lachnospiraceae bacterium]
MTGLEKGREAYENIKIPEALEQRVEQSVCRLRIKRKAQERRQRRVRRVIGMAAIFAATMTVAVNTSEAFAMEARKLPVIGELVRIMTIRSYERTEKEMQVKVEVPGVDLGENDNGLSNIVNEQIERMTSQYEAEALLRAEEYKEAFLATGGTEEEWAQHDIRVKVWYEIKSQTKDTLSFAVKGTESWTSAYAQTRYYNLDLKTNTFLTLEDLLGEDYAAIANEQIKAQIEERTNTGSVFLSTAEGGFTGIGEDTVFYINEKGNPVVVFEKYTIAPGSMGEVEFEIKK